MIRSIKQWRKGQTWSMDVLIAAALFVVALLVFYYLLHVSTSSTSMKAMMQAGSKIPSSFFSQDYDGNSLAFIINNKVDLERLKALYNVSYINLKNAIGLRYDFCVYFEDQEGNLINMSKITGLKAVGIGNPNLTISGGPCGLN